MRNRLLIGLFSIWLAIGCNAPEPDESQFNEDKFTFLVFDKKKVDSFFLRYEPVSLHNPKLLVAFRALSKLSVDTAQLPDRYRPHISPPLIDEAGLAREVLSEMEKHDKQRYWPGAISYLFFYECLPDGLRSRWQETEGGDFRFDVDFFRLVREHCPEMMKVIGRERYHWDEQMEKIMPGDAFNEIRQPEALAIKQCIESQQVFAAPQFKSHKDNFIYFLDQVISGEWRLVLRDNN